MPPKLSKSYENFYQAVKGLGDLSKQKEQFVELALRFRQDLPLTDPVVIKKKSKTATQKKKPKDMAEEDGEVTAKKKVELIEPASKEKKKQTASGKAKAKK